MAKKKWNWGTCKCSKCGRAGPQPEEEGYYYVYEAARKAGIECISMSYWHVEPLHNQGRTTTDITGATVKLQDEGMIGISGYLCTDCREKTTVGEWQRLLTHWHDSKDYSRGLNGAGCSCVTTRTDARRKGFNLVYFCGVCNRDSPESPDGYSYGFMEKMGWVNAGVGRHGDAVSVCERCKDKTTVKELQRLYDTVYIPEYRKPGYVYVPEPVADRPVIVLDDHNPFEEPV